MMGLRTTHGAYVGSYSGFDEFRTGIAAACGINLSAFYAGTAKAPDDTIMILLDHSDCDGEISPEDCTKLAARLDELDPKLTGWVAEKAARFAAGCRAAAAENRPLEFR